MSGEANNADQGVDPVIDALSGIIDKLARDRRLDPNDAAFTTFALLRELDRVGLRIIGARTGTISAGNTVSVSLTTHQQILGDRNRLQAQLDAMPTKQACGCHLSADCHNHAGVNPRGDRD